MILWAAIAMAPTAALFAIYGLLAMETAYSILHGVSSASLDLVSRLVSHHFTWGAETGYVGVSQILSQYYTKSLRMALHIACGGLVVLLGSSQFVPALRRRKSVLHRRLGMVVASAMFLSTCGALAYLASTPMQNIFSGPAFHIFLTGLALLALFLLSQAALAIASRDFRSHMIWMAACFSAYLTAPVLRLDWIIFGNLSAVSLQRANGSGGTFVLVQTLLLMLLWLTFVGDRDLPARRSIHAERSAVVGPGGRMFMAVLAALAACVALHEGVLAPAGLGLMARLRDPETVLPPQAMLWAAGTSIALWSSGSAWQAWLCGRVPKTSHLVASIVCGIAAIYVGTRESTASLDGFVNARFWMFLGATQLVVLALALTIKANSLGRNAWGLVATLMLWVPAGVALCAPLLCWLGATQYEAINGGATLILAGVVAIGVAKGMGAQVRWRPGAAAAIDEIDLLPSAPGGEGKTVRRLRAG